MPLPVSQALIELYTSEIQKTYQDTGFFLPSFCKKGFVNAKKIYWHKIPARDGGDFTRTNFDPVTFEGQGHDFVSAETQNREIATAIGDDLEQLKTNIDLRSGWQANDLAVLGRYADGQVKTAFDTGKNSTVLGPGFDVGLSVAHIHQLRETFDEAYVPNDGGRYLFVTPRVWSQLLQIEEFVNADYVGDELPYKGAGLTGKVFQTFNIIQYVATTKLPKKVDGSPWVSGVDAPNLKVGNVARCMAWHRDMMGHHVTAEPYTDISWHNDRSAHLIVTRMSMGAMVLDPIGVYAFDVDEMQPVAA